MGLLELKQTVQDFASRASQVEDCVPVGVPGLYILQAYTPERFHCPIEHPTVCLVLQGGIATYVGSDCRQCLPGDTVINGHDLPVLSKVSKASAAEPFRALAFVLDVSLLRRLQGRVGNTRFDVLNADRNISEVVRSEVVDAFTRYFTLIHQPVDKDIMAPVIREELHYRALKAHHGLMIRYLLSMGNHRGKITRAIEYLRRNYRDAATIDQLAKIAGMGLTSFHTHFREVTRTTPKQFQKELRLIEARRLLVEECLPVATVAYEVGYKSPTQFSREYSRRFGEPPSRRSSQKNRLA